MERKGTLSKVYNCSHNRKLSEVCIKGSANKDRKMKKTEKRSKKLLKENRSTSI